MKATDLNEQFVHSRNDVTNEFGGLQTWGLGMYIPTLFRYIIPSLFLLN